jgi:hypothetical protein
MQAIHGLHPSGALRASKSAPGRFVTRIGSGRFSPSLRSNRGMLLIETAYLELGAIIKP